MLFLSFMSNKLIWVLLYVSFWKSDPRTYPVRVQALKDPRNDGHYIQHQGVLVTEPQATAQRSPMGNLTVSSS